MGGERGGGTAGIRGTAPPGALIPSVARRNQLFSLG